MARNQLQLVVDPQRTVWVHDDPMLVRTLDIFDIIAPVDHWQAAIDGLSLEARVDNCFVCLCMTHHAGEDEKGILPFTLVDAFAVFVEDAPIVRVHEGIGAALQFVIHTRVGLK